MEHGRNSRLQQRFAPVPRGKKGPARPRARPFCEDLHKRPGAELCDQLVTALAALQVYFLRLLLRSNPFKTLRRKLELYATGAAITIVAYWFLFAPH